MKSATRSWSTLSLEIVFFEIGCLPRPPRKLCKPIKATSRETDEVSMSTVKSVSGFAVEVLN
jgi:hypothetical protein